MTDIYINRNRKSGQFGRVVFLFVAVLVVAVIWGIAAHRLSLPSENAAPAATSSQVTTEPPDSQLSKAEHTETRSGPTPAHIQRLLAEAKALFEKGYLGEARAICFEIIDQSTRRSDISAAQTMLNGINIQLLFSPRPMDEKVEYTIKSGDTLGKLAAEYNTTIDLIRKSNNIAGSLIRVGDRYRILKGNFSIEINRSRNDMTIYLNDRFFKRYSVGTGKYQKTPTGSFEITDRIAQPTWWRPDGKAVPYGHPENLLGTHWLSLNIRGYGIHGTWEPETIGKQSSAGCIRLLNSDIEQIYTMIPVGAPVTIKD